jgi:ABC-type amino acid transport substrate-binding protein
MHSGSARARWKVPCHGSAVDKLSRWLYFLGMVLVVLFCGHLPVIGMPANAAEPSVQTPVRVTTKQLVPMVILEGDKMSGFSIDLWTEIAKRLDLPYTWVVVDTVRDQINSVRDGTADVSIAGISMTPEREQLIDFSFPILDAGLQILVSENRDRGFFDYISGFLGLPLLKMLLWLSLFLFVIANLLWFYDRFTGKRNYPETYFRGMGEALWWTSVTLATGSYGEKEPTGAFRKTIVILWIFLGVVLVSNLTAAITTASTLAVFQERIKSVNDLPGKRIATVPNTTAAQYLSRQGIEVVPVPKIEDGFKQLEQGAVDAVVFDSPVLQYFAAHEGRGKVRTAGTVFRQEYYGIAFPEDGKLREPVNRAILEMRTDGTYQRVFDKWFKSEPLEE